MKTNSRQRCPVLGLATLLAMLSSPAAGAGSNLRFQQISLADGLSQATVNVIHQDHYGFMWFGTLEGLNRYDGYNFTVFQYDPEDQGSLSHDTVRALVEDENGVLWVGTDNGGLNRLDGTRGHFTHFRHDPEDPSGISSDRIRVMRLDSSGILWIGTDGGGLNRFDPATEEFTRFLPDPDDPSSLSHGHVRDILVDRAGRVLVGTDGGGVDIFDAETSGFRHFRHEPANDSSLSDDRVHSLHEDRDGVLWVGTAGGGLNRYDRGTTNFSRYTHDDGSGLGAGTVWTILQSREGSILVGTDNGLNEWLPETQTFSRYVHDPGDPYSLSNDRVVSLFQDQGGVIWAGTSDGLNKWNPSTGTFPHFAARPDDPRGLSQEYVTSFAEGSMGKMWVGTFGGLNRFDRASGTFDRHQHDPGDPSSLGGNRIMSLLRDDEGRLWIGMLGAGLDLFDPTTERFTHYRHRPQDPTSLSFDGVTAIHQDRHGTVWVGTYRGGLNRYDPDIDGFSRFHHDPTDPSTLSSDRVVSIYEDRSGTLWIGTDGGGLNRFERDRGVFLHHRHDPKNRTSLSSDHIWTITEGPNGDLWLGTQGGGLNRWSAADRQTGTAAFRRYLKKHGLLSSVVYSTLWDDEGNLWISTNRGLGALEPQTHTFRNYNTSNGLQNDEFNFGAAIRTRDGQLFFGGLNGFNAFYPDRIRTNGHLAPVALTSFLKSNERVDFDVPTEEVERIELGHDDAVITFEFAALDFTASDKNRYRYILEGFDRDWVDLGNRHRVTYTNLDPGHYVFRALAANNDAVWNHRGLSIEVIAKPPPWATWWAYTVYILCCMVTLALVARDHGRRRLRAIALERANRHLQQEVLDRHEAETQLHKLSLAVEQSPASVIITDGAGRIDYVNPKFEQVTGYSSDEVRGETLDLLRSGYTSEAEKQDFWRNVRAGETWRGEVHSRKKNGELFWEDVSISPITDGKGEIAHLLAINEDLTIRKEYELRLLRQAHYDHLTKLPNRTLALDRLSRAVLRNRREEQLLAVMFLDLDNFKIVNDTLGHHAGDELLVAIAGRLHSLIRGSDTVARLGGDEFLIIMPEMTDLIEVESSARRLLDSFSEPVAIEGREIFVTASLGITIAPTDSEEPQDLLRNADAAMYKAKEVGRDAYQFFAPIMNEHAVARLQLESNLRQALQHRELYLEYQPLVDTQGERIVGAEALLRWRSPKLGQVEPIDFIPVAEETGLIVPIGEWVLETACREIHNWSTLYGEPLRMAVNISGRQLRPDSDLVGTVKRALERSDLPPSHLELEVTEGVLLEDHVEATRILGELHQLGVRLAIDDFGTGYSSLRYLRQYPFDVLKIDRSFVDDLTSAEGNASLVRAIIAMAGGLGLEVVGEGVESRTQLSLLRAMGCPLVQGFLFSRPLPARSLARLLAEGGSLKASYRQVTEPGEPVFRPRLVSGGHHS